MAIYVDLNELAEQYVYGQLIFVLLPTCAHFHEESLRQEKHPFAHGRS